MSPEALCFRGVIIRAVIGVRPAILARVADLAALDQLCEYLADCEQAKKILRDKGYGQPWQSLAEIAELVPEAIQPRQDILDIWTAR